MGISERKQPSRQRDGVGDLQWRGTVLLSKHVCDQACKSEQRERQTKPWKKSTHEENAPAMREEGINQGDDEKHTLVESEMLLNIH